jgi:hypothetical protein
MLRGIYCRIMYGTGCCYGWDLDSAELRMTDRMLMMRDASLRDEGARRKSSVLVERESRIVVAGIPRLR